VRSISEIRDRPISSISVNACVGQRSWRRQLSGQRQPQPGNSGAGCRGGAAGARALGIAVRIQPSPQLSRTTDIWTLAPRCHQLGQRLGRSVTLTFLWAADPQTWIDVTRVRGSAPPNGLTRSPVERRRRFGGSARSMSARTSSRTRAVPHKAVLGGAGLGPRRPWRPHCSQTPREPLEKRIDVADILASIPISSNIPSGMIAQHRRRCSAPPAGASPFSASLRRARTADADRPGRSVQELDQSPMRTPGKIPPAVPRIGHCAWGGPTWPSGCGSELCRAAVAEAPACVQQTRVRAITGSAEPRGSALQAFAGNHTTPVGRWSKLLRRTPTLAEGVEAVE
jgi:hypothetical protein